MNNLSVPASSPATNSLLVSDGRVRARFTILILAAVAFVAVILAIAVGPVFLSPLTVLSVFGQRLGLIEGVDPTAVAVVEQLRLPRALLGLMVGAVLATSGAAMQGMFRNPLADPGLIGVSSGAGLAATVAIVLGSSLLGAGLFDAWAQWLIPIASFMGALATTAIVTLIANRSGRTVVTTMLLAGVAIAAISGAGIGYMVFMADDAQLRDLTFWGMGSLGGTTWSRLLIAGPPMIIAAILLCRWGRQLNGMVLGERAAMHLGIKVEILKRRLIITVALGVGCAVAVSGGIGFVGLVVPHLIRLAAGPDHRLLMPAAAFGGGALLLGADLFARTAASPAELPIGVVTATIGGPFFLWLLIRGAR